MRVFRILVFILLIPSFAGAAYYGYPVKDFPEALMKNANVFVRDDAMTFKVHSRSSMVLTVKFAVTVLNSKGSRYAVEAVHYNKLIKINYFRGAVYNSAGVQIRKHKNSEIKDQSINDGVALYRDDRVKIADLSSATYPYTVEFEYEQEYKYLYDIPDSWRSEEHTSELQSRENLVC